MPALAATLREASLNCPFCDEEIKDTALVCKHCGRDLMILRPVLQRFEDLEARLEAVETALQTLSGHVDTVRSRDLTAGTSPVDVKDFGKSLARLCLLIALLLVAHWVIIGVFDLNTLVLRLVSILIPLPFGLLGPKSLRATIWTAMVAGIVSVWGMLAITGAIDNVPIMPQGSRDWIETLEYVASIALAFGTGRLVSAWRTSRRSSESKENSLVYEIASLLVKSSAPKNETRVHAKQRIESLANWLNILALIVTAGCSIATGVARFIH
jgi:hypothetical protein